MKPTQAELLEIFDYDPISGILTRKGKESGSGRGFRRAGRVAGHVRSDGYVHVQVGEKSHYAHCVIWCMKKGCWPEKQIDHRNLRRSENWWGNLRESTPSQNKANIKARNDIDAKGVEIIHSGKYRARIRVMGKSYHLGCFAKLSDAKKAYKTAAVLHFGEFART